MPICRIPFEDLSAAIVESCQELQEHSLAIGGESSPPIRLTGAYRSPADLRSQQKGEKVAAGCAQFTLHWVSGRPMLPLAWDRWICEDVTRAQFESALVLQLRDTGGPVDEAAQVDEWVSDLPVPPPDVMHYHPMRMKALLPFSKQLMQIGARCEGLVGEDDLRRIHQLLSEAMMKRQLHSTIRERKKYFDTRRVMAMVEVLAFMAAYAGHGQQIFDMPVGLVERFRNTDVDDIPVQMLQLPYPALYLHFGPQEDIAWHPMWVPEGAYVWDVVLDGQRQVLQFSIVHRARDPQLYPQFDVYPDPSYQFSLGPELLGTDLGTAVDHALAGRRARLLKQAQDDPLAQEIRKLREQGLTQGVRSVASEHARTELANLPVEHYAFGAMLKLVVNSLCYLTAYPDDIETHWPKDTPQDLLARLRSAQSPGARREAATKLSARGFTPIHLTGRKLVEQGSEGYSDGTRERRATHWRRGHWRRQAHGPQRSLRKLVWLMPMLINRSEATGEEVPGHVYLVD